MMCPIIGRVYDFSKAKVRFRPLQIPTDHIDQEVSNTT